MTLLKKIELSLMLAFISWTAGCFHRQPVPVRAPVIHAPPPAYGNKVV